MNDIEARIKDTIQQIRPFLQEDGGDLEFVRYEEATKVLEIRLLGNCKQCPLAIMTLRAGIERMLIYKNPEIKRVEAVR